MRIDRLVVENFRRLRRADLEMPDGVIAVVGANGAGKSTLLEAIGWCLYGMDAARTGKELLKREGAAPSDDVRVRLAFTHAGQSYEVTRELRGTSGSAMATVVVGGQVVVAPGAHSAREATEHVARLFHMDETAFFTSVVARQRELSALTDARPAERKRVMMGLLRLDAVDTAIALARERKRDARARLAGLRSAIVDPAPLREALQRVRAALTDDAQRLLAMDATIRAGEEEVEGYRERQEAAAKVAQEHKAHGQAAAVAAARAEAARREAERLALDLAAAKAAAEEAATLAPRLVELHGARARVERLRSLRVRHDELTRVHKAIADADAEVARATAESAHATAEVAAASAVRTLAARVVTERARLDAALLDAQATAAKHVAAQQEAARTLAKAETHLSRIRELGPHTACPTCARPLEEHHDALLASLSDEIARGRGAVEREGAALRGARDGERALRDQLAALAARDAELRAKGEKLAREEVRLKAAARAAEEAAARAGKLRDQAAALAAEPFDPAVLAEAERAAALLETLRDRHVRLLALGGRAGELTMRHAGAAATEQEAVAAARVALDAQAALAFDPAAHAALEAAARRAAATLLEHRLARERLQGDRARRSDEERRLVADLARHAELTAQATSLEVEVSRLERLAGDRDHGLLPEFKDHVIGRVRPLLAERAAALFRETTGGRYHDLELDEGFGLLVHDEGKAYPLARFSGGEADLANLCLRLAVSAVVAERAGSEGLGFLALDEVFGSQDEARKASIMQALKGLSGRFRQVLLVTHIPDVKEAADGILRVDALEDGSSRVVVDA